MTLKRMAQLARMASAFRNFVRSPLTRDTALAIVRRQLAEREDRFIHQSRRLVYECHSSPYRKLLVWAGCGHGDLEASVRRYGLEKTLKRLHDGGVRPSLDEFKCRTPICRPGLTIETCESDFDNPVPGGSHVEGQTSGSRGRSTRVAYDWEFIAEESAHELLLYDLHGVRDAPLALWYPVPPGIAGIHNLLMSLKHGHAPDAWFSHTPPKAMPLEGRLAVELTRWQGGAPRPAFVDLSNAGLVVAWLAGIRACGRPGVLRTYCSSAVRVAQVAIATGTDISGSVIFSGGEPLSADRRRLIESSGASVYPRYIATESGLVAAACPHREGADDMHLYKDRLAVIESAGTLHYTSLTAHAGKILFNTELGDRGDLTLKPCSCLFGEIGFDLHLANVRSAEKLTVEGVTLAASDLYDAIGAVMQEAFGASSDSCQVHQVNDDGLDRLFIAVSPDVTGFEEATFINGVLGQLERGSPGSALAAKIWRQATTLCVVREHPQVSVGQKVLAVGPVVTRASH